MIHRDKFSKKTKQMESNENILIIKLNIKKIFIDKLGELHIITEREEIIFKQHRVKDIISNNSFQFRNQIHVLFENEKDPKRQQILEAL